MHSVPSLSFSVLARSVPADSSFSRRPVWISLHSLYYRKAPPMHLLKEIPSFGGGHAGWAEGQQPRASQRPCGFLRKSVRHTLSLLKGLFGGSASSGQLLFFLSEPLTKVCTATPLAFSLHHAFRKQCLSMLAFFLSFSSFF